MDFLSRLIGGNYAPKKLASKSAAFDPDSRLARYQKVYDTILQLCNRPRNPETEAPLFFQLQACLERLATLTREETRAPVPHVCLQFASKQQIYAVIGRAAAVSQNEPIINAAVAVYAALVDSEEEDFLSNSTFAKSLMRLIKRAIDNGNMLVGLETETAILELLFTISAKIRLQPDILPVWFQNTHKPELEDVFVQEKRSFVGITQKDDFPLCYLLIDRVHHEGRIGDFARTGLLYVFESTGKSAALEEWVVASDLSTLMATGLGALYSQLSRELSILHPDSTLPAVLAMSDYSTTHPRATAESAFSDRHQSHMATFLSYLAFWQDVLDHCRSANVKQTLLDHFQILFLQQLLYPSLLQSSDTDAGSSVAVLTYMTAMLETLDYPDLVHMMLTYLLNLQQKADAMPRGDDPATAGRPRSPTTVRRRQSLMLLTAPKNPDAAIDPGLFSLVDLVINSIGSRNAQTAFTGLRLTSTLVTKQQEYTLGTVLKTETSRSEAALRTAGVLAVEVEKYSQLAAMLHQDYRVQQAYPGVCDDIRAVIEAQIPYVMPEEGLMAPPMDTSINSLDVPVRDPLLQALTGLMRTFFTNSVDVNLALTQAVISIASCAKLRTDAWITSAPSSSSNGHAAPEVPARAWQIALDQEESDAWKKLRRAVISPPWSDDTAPSLYRVLSALIGQIEEVRGLVANLDHLLAARKDMLQALGPGEPPSPIASPNRAGKLNVTGGNEYFDPGLSAASRGRTFQANTTTEAAKPAMQSTSVSPVRSPPQQDPPSAGPPSIFQPPPPDSPSTTDVLMQEITFPLGKTATDPTIDVRSASLNHVLTNIIVLQEFILELVAVLQVRAAVLGEREISFSSYDSVQDTPIAT